MRGKSIDMKALFKLMGIFVLMMVVGNGIQLGAGFALINAGITVPFIVYSILLYVPMIAIAILYTSNQGEAFWKACGFKKIKAGTVFLAILLTVVFYPMVMFANVFSQLFTQNTVVQGADAIIGDSPVLYIISIALLAPVCEEILLRGFFHNRMKKLIPFTAAAILSGFWFGVLHLNLNQFCYAWLSGIIFAYVNRASGSILTSMIMHFIMNLFGSVAIYLETIFYKNQGKNFAEVAENMRADSNHMMLMLAVTGVLAIASFFLTRLIIKAIAKSEGNDYREIQEDAVA